MSRFSGFTSSRQKSTGYQSQGRNGADSLSNPNSSRKTSDVELATYQEQKLSELQPTVVMRSGRES